MLGKILIIRDNSGDFTFLRGKFSKVMNHRTISSLETKSMKKRENEPII